MAQRTVAVRLLAHVGGYVGGMRQAQLATQQTAASATRLSTGTAAAGTAMAAGATQAGKLNTGIKQAGASMGGVAASAGLMRGSLLNPITAVGAAAVGATKAAIDWESAWAGVQKTVDGSAGQMERLEGDLRSMAGELPASHQEIAAVAEAAGQLGVKVDDVADFTRTMIDLGESTNMSAEQAATGLARFSNIMGTSEDDTRRLGSTLVDLGNNMATTEGEILELSTRLAAASSIIGLTEAETMAFAATMSSVGVEAQAGGTALSKVFQTVNDAVLSGSEELEVFAEVAGTTAQEFATRFREDPAGAIAEFIAGLGRMNEAGQSTSQVFADLGLQDQRLMRALLSTAEAGDLLTQSIDLASGAWEENTALTEEAQRRYDTMAAQLSAAMGKIKNAAIDLGEVFGPVVVGAAEAVAEVAGFLSEADRQIRDFGEEALPEGQIPLEDLLPMVGEAFVEGDVFSGTARRMEEYSESAHAATGATKTFTSAAERGRDRTDELGGAAGEATGPVTDLGNASETSGEQHSTAAERLQEYIDATKAATDPVFGMLDAVQQVDEAQRAYNDAVDEHGPKSEEATQAGFDLAEAIAAAEVAALNGDLSFDEFTDKLDAWAEQGLIDEEVAGILGEAIAGLRGEAEDYAGPYNADIDARHTEQARRKLQGVQDSAQSIPQQRTVNVNTSGTFHTRNLLNGVRATVLSIPTSRTIRIGMSGPGAAVGVQGSPQGHSGGLVTKSGFRRFHGGGQAMGGDGAAMRANLAPDEVPAILQTREVVSSRAQVSQVRAGMDMLGRALSPMLLGRPVAAGSFHNGGAVGGGSTTFKHVFEARGGAAGALVDQINYHLRQGEINIKTEAVQR